MVGRTMETDRIIATDEGRIVGWQDGATVAMITWKITWNWGTTEWARECFREEAATGLLLLVDRDRDCRLVSAELLPRVTSEDLWAAIAPGNRDVVEVGHSNSPERCMCADEVLYTVTAKPPNGKAVTVGPMSSTSPRDPDVVGGMIGLLREEQPDAEITVESSPNRDYRKDCLRLIAEDAAYVKYVGAGSGSRDNLYCQRCAPGKWGTIDA